MIHKIFIDSNFNNFTIKIFPFHISTCVKYFWCFQLPLYPIEWVVLGSLLILQPVGRQFQFFSHNFWRQWNDVCIRCGTIKDLNNLHSLMSFRTGGNVQTFPFPLISFDNFPIPTSIHFSCSTNLLPGIWCVQEHHSVERMHFRFDFCIPWFCYSIRWDFSIHLCVDTNGNENLKSITRTTKAYHSPALFDRVYDATFVYVCR